MTCSRSTMPHFCFDQLLSSTSVCVITLYLHCREQFVKIHRRIHCSSIVNTKRVPLGTKGDHIYPLLLSLFISAIKNIMRHCHILLFANPWRLAYIGEGFGISTRSMKLTSLYATVVNRDGLSLQNSSIVSFIS